MQVWLSWMSNPETDVFMLSTTIIICMCVCVCACACCVVICVIVSVAKINVAAALILNYLILLPYTPYI